MKEETQDYSGEIGESTSSMVAAICYVWFLENRMKAHKERGEEDISSFELIVPMMNTRREKMWKQRQAAWLFYHIGHDATALFFSNEVDLETFMMVKKLSTLVVGEDILRTNSEPRNMDVQSSVPKIKPIHE
ncbi:uncharacterized protein Fot_04254 [Forsythia ovata]|uniref:Uncharacterized protein n=1 Tax=Forsythia ovata TaxID=205694 RepID=A0ABD1XC12_9LAMI